MATKPSGGPEIKVGHIDGINLRKSKSQLDAGEFDRFQGGYPLKTGSMTRMPGKLLMRVFEDGTTPLAVYNAAQLFDGTGNVLVQFGGNLGVYSLDELLNRVTDSSLTFPSFTDEEAFTVAMMLHVEASGVNGGSVAGFTTVTDGSSATNVFYGRRLTSLAVNESSTVSAFRAAANSTVTVTIANPGVLTWGAGSHGLSVNDEVVLVTTGALPTGLTAGTVYYVSNVPTGSTFRLSATRGGADITTTGSQSGTHTGSIPGLFTLAAGRYRIRVNACYPPGPQGSNIFLGLWNGTSFQTDDSGTAICALMLRQDSSEVTYNGNYVTKLSSAFTISGSTTYQLSHKTNNPTAGRANTYTGHPTSMVGTIVNGGAPRNTYCEVTIIKES